jgi:DNA-binding HxlR family transcriptional regulator
MSIIKNTEIPDFLLKYSPIVFVTNVLSHKWTLFILMSLEKPFRFNQLQRALGVSHTVLSKELKEMINLDLVKRCVINETNPPSVEYCLNENGQNLLNICFNMLEWAKKFENNYFEQAKKSGLNFDRSNLYNN